MFVVFRIPREEGHFNKGKIIIKDPSDQRIPAFIFNKSAIIPNYISAPEEYKASFFKISANNSYKYCSESVEKKEEFLNSLTGSKRIYNQINEMMYFFQKNRNGEIEAKVYFENENNNLLMVSIISPAGASTVRLSDVCIDENAIREVNSLLYNDDPEGFSKISFIDNRIYLEEPNIMEFFAVNADLIKIGFYISDTFDNPHYFQYTPSFEELSKNHGKDIFIDEEREEGKENILEYNSSEYLRKLLNRLIIKFRTYASSCLDGKDRSGEFFSDKFMPYNIADSFKKRNNEKIESLMFRKGVSLDAE